MVDVALTGQSRVFTMDGGARPNTAPKYQEIMRAGALSWPQGDVTLVRIPSSSQYGRFKVVGKVTGEEGNPELPLSSRFLVNERSVLFKLAKQKCDSDFRIHFGACADPKDPIRGWEKIIILQAGRITDYSTDELGALGSDESAIVNDTGSVTGEDAYEVMPITFAEKAGTQVAREVVDIAVCDSAACADCGAPSDGCQKVLALTKSSDSSPGLVAEIVYSDDGGLTWDDVDINSLGATEDPNSLACVGNNLVVISEESISLHYAALADIFLGSPTWAEVTSGFVAGGAPRAIIAISSTDIWIVGAGGYIYYTSDPTSSVTVQDAGVATTQQLNDISGIDTQNLIAVGASNAIVVTTNGGETWQLVIGPSVGVALNAVWMIDERTWWVGTAGGRLYYTVDAGTTWTEKAFSGSGAGQVYDIKFTTPVVGYMSHATAAPVGRLFRTIDGGFSWYAFPEKSGFTLPDNDRINAIAVCSDPNVIYGGGLGGAALDGIIVAGKG